MNRKFFAGILAVIMVLALLAGCQSGTNPSAPPTTTPPAGDTGTPSTETPDKVETIKIGLVTNLTGSNAETGRQAKLANDLMVDWINENGGVKAFDGAKVELHVIDLMSDANQAAMILKRELDAHPEIVALVGPSSSATTLPILPVLQEYGIITSTGGTSSAIVDQGCEYIFMVNPYAPLFSECQAGFVEYMVDLQGLDKDSMRLAIVYENSSWGTDIAKNAKTQYGDAGYNIVLEETFPTDQLTDASPIVTKLKNANVDLVLLASSVNDTKLIRSTMQAMNYNPWCVGGGAGFVWPSFYLDLGDSANGVFSTASWAYDLKSTQKNPYWDEIVNLYETRYNEPLAEQTGHNIAHIMMVIDAIENGKSLDRTVIRDEFRKLTGENSVWFALFGENSRFNEVNYNVGGYPTVAQWQNGKLCSVFPIETAGKQILDPDTLEPLN